jgi:competence protein ComEC
LKFYQQIPFFRLIIPFLVGILTATFLPHQFDLWWLIFSCSGFITIGLGFFKPLFTRYGWRWIYGIILTLSLFVNGYFLTVGNIEHYSPDHFGNQVTEKNWLQVKVTNPPEEKAKSYKISVQVESYRDHKAWLQTEGKAITYFQKTEAIKTIRYGDVLLINTEFTEIKPPMNPGEFNYKRYLGFHNIYHQAYISETDWVHTGNNQGNFLFVWSNSLRTYLLDVFREYGILDNEFAVASALILGYKGALEDELMRAYSSAGATHVLAVSGLHVGIIYVILNGFLVFFDRIKYGNILKAIILISFLWFYALLTGLSPSVLRAVTMFSFIVVAKATKRNTNIYNTLAVSAFFLLLYNPLLLMEVGFQLSYLAVIGIVYLHPKIYGWFNLNNWLLDKMWSITAVSISAQIATFPIALLYFHQFPNYFFISNLIVIPLVTVIVYTGILLFLVSWVPVVAIWVAKGLFWSIWVMNYCVRVIESIPYSLTKDLSIDGTETVIIYIIIITTLVFFAYKKANYLCASLGSLLVLVSYQMYQTSFQIQQSKFVVYNVARTSVFEFIDGQTSYLVADSSFINNDKKMSYSVKPHWLKTGATNNICIEKNDSTSSLIKSYGDGVYSYSNQTVAIVTSQQHVHNSPLSVDYLIVSQIKYLDLDKLILNYEFKHLIFDSSNPKWITQQWKTEALEMGLAVHSVPNDGAFVFNS